MLPPFYSLPQALRILPSQAGSYLLHLRLEIPAQVQVGRLGVFHLPAGRYFYCGSAFGPGGIRARVLRHIRAGGKPHWHIDALRSVAMIEGVAWQEGVRAECTWSQLLASQPEGQAPVPGFGASDCRAGCPAHLILQDSTRK